MAFYLGLDRRDLVNDDLQMFATIPASLGRLGAVAMERTAYVTFMNNASFFTAGNKNVSTGTGSALGLAGIDAAMKVWVEQTDLNGDPTMMMPAVLLTAAGLFGTARSLMASDEIQSGNTTGQPANNPWANLAQPVTSAYLTSATITGNSATAWYLLAGPGDFSVLDCCLLDGRVAPIVESEGMDFNQLGLSFRSYHDFGFALMEHRGGVRSAGV